MITDSVQGRQKIDQLHRELTNLPYNPDLNKLLTNTNNLCTRLSVKEILYRNTKQKRHTSDAIKDLNDAIDRLEKYIIIAKLIA